MRLTRYAAAFAVAITYAVASAPADAYHICVRGPDQRDHCACVVITDPHCR